MKKIKQKKAVVEEKTIRLNLGSGKSKLDGFIGVDIIKFDSVDVVCNLGKDKWPWDDSSVSEAIASHMIEHLDASERIHFVNELYRVLKPDAQCRLITPHWASCRAYGDLTHKWPPVSEFWPAYLNQKWREDNAPHNQEYTCNFEHVPGYTMRLDIAQRDVNFQQFALSFYKEAADDLHIVLTAKKE